MGWEWTFDFEFEHGYPSAEAFAQLFSAVAQSTGRETLEYFDIAVKKRPISKKEKRRNTHETENYEDIEIEKAVALALAAGDNFNAALGFGGTRKRLDGTPYPYTRFELKIYPKWYFYYPWPENSTNHEIIPAVRYDVGRGMLYCPDDSHGYKKWREAAEYNLAQARRELAAMFMAVTELKSIRGDSMDASHHEPLESSLVFHRSFGQFLTDIGQPADMLSDDAILDIMLAFQKLDPDFTIELHPSGVEVCFAHRGSCGSLKRFYEFLQQQVTGAK